MNWQLPLLTPQSDWVPPATLPDWRGRDLAIDLETKDEGLAADRGPGWAYGAGYICGVAMACEDDQVYAPMRHPETNNFDPDRVAEWYIDHVKSSSRVVYHQAPYDLGWARYEFGAPPPKKLDDSLGMCFMLDEQRLQYNLDAVCEWLGIPGKDQRLLDEAALAYRGAILTKDKKKKLTEREIKSMIWRLPGRYVGPYAEQDGRATFDAAKIMRPRVVEQGISDAYQLEMDLVPMILEMRARGILIDMDEAERTRVDFLRVRDQHLKILSEKLSIGRAVTIKDISSRSFLETVFSDAKIPVPRTQATDKYKDGQASFETEWMEKIDHWLPQNIFHASKYHWSAEKFIGKYIQGYAHMGRVHADIHQYKDEDGGTRTYRFSYSDPPLQQMPSRNALIAPRIRKLFLPEEGSYWFAPDYSQQEYRLIVHFAAVCHMAGVEDAVRLYNEDPDTDFHNLVVELTGLVRRRAKDVNFAKAFGAGVAKFAIMTGMSLDEAEKTMKQYDEKMPFVSRFAEFCQSRAEKKGFLRLIDGARVRFERWEPRWLSKSERARGYRDHFPMAPCYREEAEARCADEKHPWYRASLRRAFCHKSMNWLIQGSAARQTKLAMRECWRMKVLPLIQMHDELGIPVDNHKITKMIQEAMCEVVKLVVPVKVDGEYGPSWGEAKYRDTPEKGKEKEWLGDWNTMTQRYPLRMAA